MLASLSAHLIIVSAIAGSVTIVSLVAGFPLLADSVEKPFHELRGAFELLQRFVMY